MNGPNKHLSFRDRYLTIWIFPAMVGGLCNVAFWLKEPWYKGLDDTCGYEGL